MRHFYILFLFLPILGFSQVTLPRGADTCPVNDKQPVILKTSLISILQQRRMFTLGMEVPVYKTITAQLEGGYIYDVDDITYRLNNNKGSFELKADGKFYVKELTTLRFYTGPMIAYRQLNAQKGNIILQSYIDESGLPQVCAYLDMQNAETVCEKQTTLLWQAGVQPLVLNHLAIDVFLGLGVGFEKTITKKNDENTDALINSRTFSASLVGLHIGYAF